MKGLSVIIPIYQGKSYMKRCLDSLYQQTLDYENYEILLVFNGDYEADVCYFNSIKTDYTGMNILTFYDETSSAGRARNIGIQQASFSHITFVDIDDYVADSYLQSFYDHMDDLTVVINPLHDDGAGVIKLSPIYQRPLTWDGKNIRAIHGILTMTVCKAIPAKRLRHYRFNEQMKSGEDVLFFTDFFTHEVLKIYVEKSLAPSYYRVITENSISRQPISYDFNINQRLKSLLELNRLLLDVKDRSHDNVVHMKIRAQLSTMTRYLLEQPADYTKVMLLLRKYRYRYAPISFITNRLIDVQFLKLRGDIVSGSQQTDIITGLLYKLYQPEAKWTLRLDTNFNDYTFRNIDLLRQLKNAYHIEDIFFTDAINPFVVMALHKADFIVIEDASLLKDFDEDLRIIIDRKTTSVDIH